MENVGTFMKRTCRGDDGGHEWGAKEGAMLNQLELFGSGRTQPVQRSAKRSGG